MPLTREQSDSGCAAPPERLVLCCKLLGMKTPEDVCWIEVSAFLEKHGLRPQSRSGTGWNELLETLGARLGRCSCGEPLPYLIGYRFSYPDGAREKYWLAQCRKCRAIYWQKFAKALTGRRRA